MIQQQVKPIEEKEKKGSSDALRTKDKEIISAAEKLEKEVLAHAEIAKKGGGIWGNIDQRNEKAQ